MSTDHLEKRRLAAVAAAACARPPAFLKLRRVGQRKVGTCERTWRWLRSVGVLVLVAITLFVTVFFSDKDSSDQSHRTAENLHHLEARSIELRNALDKNKPRRDHFHDGISRVRKLHGSMARSTNVILLSYHRSGANQLAEFLTLGPNAAYFSEPFVSRKHHNASSTVYQDMVDSLFSCQRNVLYRLATSRPLNRVIRKLGRWKSNDLGMRLRHESSASLVTKCLHTTVRVLESTRLHLDTLAPLFSRENDDLLRVIHLVRDPRHVVDSRVRGNDMASKSFCKDVIRDVEVGKKLLKDDYLLVRYEEFHKNPIPTLQRIYAFLGISSWMVQAKEYLSKLQSNKRNRSTESSKKSTIITNPKKMQADCSKALKILKYDLNPV